MAGIREVVFDTETTGAARDDRIIEIGMVEMIDRQMTGRVLDMRFDPEGRAIHWGAQRVHGISAADLLGKPRFREKVDEILDFAGSDPLLAHNASFDARMLNAELVRSGLAPLASSRFLCTLKAAQRSIGGRCGMDAMIKRYLAGEERGKHSAIEDATLLARMLPNWMGKGRDLQTGPSRPAPKSGAVIDPTRLRVGSDVPRELSREISLVNNTRDAGELRLGGRDIWSSLDREKLINIVSGSFNADLVESEMSHLSEKRQLAALRWICRGLDTEIAVAREEENAAIYDDPSSEPKF